MAVLEPVTLVGRWAPFHRTTHLLQKFAPVTFIVKVVPPAVVLPGERLLSVSARPPEPQPLVEVDCAVSGNELLSRKTATSKKPAHFFTGGFS